MDVAILVIWAVFWVGWLIAALAAKPSLRRRRPARPIGLLIIVAGAIVIRAAGAGRPGGLLFHPWWARGIGAALVLCGLGIAVWARVTMGRNWGMPMTQREEPELVTGGPYHLIRHPIYSGIVLATVGTALAVSLGWLFVAAVMGVYFGYCATVEEQTLVAEFPDAYPGYQAQTKMLIPFIL